MDVLEDTVTVDENEVSVDWNLIYGDYYRIFS
jgi:hypothetical protein